MYTRMKLERNPRMKIKTRYRGNRTARRYARMPRWRATKLGKLGLNGYSPSLLRTSSASIGRGRPMRYLPPTITAAVSAYETKKRASSFLFFQNIASAKRKMITNKPRSVATVLPRNVITGFSNRFTAEKMEASSCARYDNIQRDATSCVCIVNTISYFFSTIFEQGRLTNLTIVAPLDNFVYNSPV